MAGAPWGRRVAKQDYIRNRTSTVRQKAALKWFGAKYRPAMLILTLPHLGPIIGARVVLTIDQDRKGIGHCARSRVCRAVNLCFRDSSA